MPKISVLMSVYKEPLEWFEPALRSILTQSDVDLECILVVDWPENHEVLAFLNSLNDPRLKVVVNEKNMGLVYSLNRALEHASGDFIARMDADDFSEPNRFALQLKHLNDNPTLSLVGAWMVRVNELGEELGVAKIPLENSVLARYARWNTPCYHPTWLARKEVYDKLGGYREVRFAEDYDFLLRALEFGFALSNLPQKLLRYRVNQKSLSNQNSFEQQAMKRRIQYLFKQKKLNTTSVLDINFKNKPVDQVKKAIKANDLFIQALDLKNKGLFIKTIFALLKSAFVSSSQRSRFLDMVSHYSFTRTLR